jgi:ADP-ribosyl-[dinitrogen reductase] hydrolase
MSCQIAREERIAGCLLAGALGDAIGSRFEGGAPTSEFSIPAELRVTDDTQLTIATCEAIVSAGDVNPESIAQHFVSWFRAGRIRGIGMSTWSALSQLDAGGHWASVGASGEHSAGNGAAMRIAPLAFLLNPDEANDRRTIRDVCRITHRNDEAYVGALVIVRSIRHAVGGAPLNDAFLANLVERLPDSRVRDRLIEVRDSAISVRDYAMRFGSSGYVVDSVPLAVLAAAQSADFLETIEQIVKCGGDTDTIASMYGQIYGAAFGSEGLPMDIVNRIDEVSLVRETVAKFPHSRIVR